jgi:hypothetical protein
LVDVLKTSFSLKFRGGLGLIFLGLGQAWASYFGLGLENLLNKLGFSQALALALLHK